MNIDKTIDTRICINSKEESFKKDDFMKDMMIEAFAGMGIEFSLKIDENCGLTDEDAYKIRKYLRDNRIIKSSSILIAENYFNWCKQEDIVPNVADFKVFEMDLNHNINIEESEVVLIVKMLNGYINNELFEPRDFQKEAFGQLSSFQGSGGSFTGYINNSSMHSVAGKIKKKQPEAPFWVVAGKNKNKQRRGY